jgi:hypothetical protein
MTDALPRFFFIAPLWFKRERRLFKYLHAPKAKKVLVITEFVREVRNSSLRELPFAK